MKDLDYEINRICTFITENVIKTNSDGVIIALSGGLDSAVVAALSTKAIAKENVHCYFLRYTSSSSDIDKRHTDALCKKFGLTYEENQSVSQASQTSFFNRTIAQITDIVNSFIVKNDYLHVISGNIYTTIITGYLEKKAKEHNSLVLGTTNRSEQLIGYFTKFAESGCDLQPILHLYKTEIVEVAKHLGIPGEIINRVPSADHWYGQTKENGLTYQKLDKILIELEKRGSDAQECKVNGSTKQEVFQVITMVEKAKHKCRFPPCLENCY